MKKDLQSKVKILLAFTAAILLLTVGRMHVNHALKHHAIEDILKMHISNIGNELDFAVRQTYTLQSLVVGADGTAVDLDDAGDVLGREETTPFLEYVLLAPNGIVTQVYPMEGNDRILGTNLFSEAYENVDAVMKAQKTGELVVSHSLTAGMEDADILAYLPVYLPNGDGTYETWGIVSVCVAFPEIFANLRTDVLKDQGYAYRVVGIDKESGTESELYSNGFQDISHIISGEFVFAEMDLRIDVAPERGWLNVREAVWFVVQSLGICLFLGMIFRFAYRNLRRLLTEANTDELTGLLNRAAGERQIDRLIQGKDFQNGIFLMIDLDNFKVLNDTMGHQRGDEALKRCAVLLRSLFREDDIVCRLGGDEFVVFLPCGGDISFMEEKAQKLLKAMKREVVENGRAVHISASVGIALAPEHGTTFDELYAKADKALYRSKAMGRDCCVLYGGNLMPREGKSAAAQTAPKSYAERRAILIVDDDFINRVLIKNIFSERFSFVEAENGQQGLDKVKEYGDDLCAILVDANMPVMGGLEMLRILHSGNIPHEIPVFMITAHTESEVAKEAYAYGVRDVITKPIMPVVIQNRVQTVIELFQARDMLKHILKDPEKNGRE